MNILKNIRLFIARIASATVIASMAIGCIAGTVMAGVIPPTMTPIPQPQGQYYNTTPVLSLEFQDNVHLWSVSYQVDSFAEGSWLNIINNWSTTSWSQAAWANMQGFPSLADGSHTIYFKASDMNGNQAGQNGEWSWQFFKDTTAPLAPAGLTSSSHITSVWSLDNTVDIVWTDSIDAGIGLKGYSVVWDSSPLTVPPASKNVNPGVETSTSPALPDGNVYYFHIRPVDTFDYWGSASHIGPFFIDTEAPVMDAIVNPAGQYQNTAPVLSLGFHDNLALDDGYYQYDSFAGAWTPIFNNTTGESWTAANWTLPGFTGLPDGSHTIYFRVTDDAGHNVGAAGQLSWTFIKDVTPPAAPGNVTSSSHTVSTWSLDMDVDVTWLDSVDAQSGLAGYSVVWDTAVDTIPEPEINVNPAVRASTSPSLSSSNSVYFHIRPADIAGNWGATVHVGPFWVDTTAPGQPGSLTSTSHTPGTWSSDNSIDMTWTDAIDSHSGLDGYSVVWDNDPTGVPDAIKDIEDGVLGSTSQPLADGNTIYFHIRAVDALGNWGTTVHRGPYFVDMTPPLMTPLVEPEDIYYPAAPTFAAFGFTDNLAINRGWYQIDSTVGSWLPIFTSAPGTIWSSDGWTLPGFDSLSQGPHTVYFRASDDCGNIAGGDGEWSWSFIKDTEPPSLPASLTSTSHSLQAWSNDNTIDLTWVDSIDTLSGIDGYSYIWNDNPTAIPDEVKNINGGLGELTSPVVPDGNNIYFHIRAVDIAGSWSTTLHYGPFYIDTIPPTKNTMTAIEGQYHTTSPVFSTFEFNDNVALDKVWYQVDSFTGAWTSLVSGCPGTTWERDGWALPGFDQLSEGSHTLFFKAADDTGNVAGGNGEWSYQFFKDTVAPAPPSNLNPQSHVVGRWSSDNTVEIRWSAATDVTSAIAGYSFVWDNVQDTTPDLTINVTGDILTTTSQALEDGYANYFHIRAADNAGNWSTVVHVGPFAIDTAPPEKITNLRITNTARTSVTLSWTVPEDNLTDCTLYDIRYSTSPITDVNFAVATHVTEEHEPLAAGRIDSIQVTGLTTNVTYYFAMKVSDGVQNTSLMSNVVYTTTTNSPPDLSGVVSPDRAYNTNALTFSVTYSDVEGDEPASVAVSIDGGTPENLAIRPGQTIDYVAGVVYEWVTSAAGLSPGYHTIQFSAHDGSDDAINGAEATESLYILSSIIHRLSDYVSDGRFIDETVLASQDSILRLVFPQNGTATDASGAQLTTLSIREVKRPPVLPDETWYIGPVFEISPDGASFDPPITIVMDYIDFQLPPDADEDCLFFTVYDEETGRWMDIPAVIDPEAGTITINTNHFSIYALIARTGVADISVTGLDIDPVEVGTGRVITATATLTNAGNLEGTYPVELLLNGTPVMTKNVTVAGSSTATTVFELTAGEIGTYTVTAGTLSRSFTVRTPIPATFSVTDLDMPENAIAGDVIRITAAVVNIGDETGSYPVNLEIDGTITQTQTASCPPGGVADIIFELTLPQPGSYIVSVQGQTNTINITEVVAPASVNTDSILVTLMELSALEAAPDEEISVLALLTSMETGIGVQQIPLFVNDGVFMFETVDFSTGQTQEVMYYVSFSEPGSYVLSVGSESQTLVVGGTNSAGISGLLTTSNLMLFAVLFFVFCAGLLIFMRIRKNGAGRLGKYLKFLPFLNKKANVENTASLDELDTIPAAENKGYREAKQVKKSLFRPILNAVGGTLHGLRVKLEQPKNNETVGVSEQPVTAEPKRKTIPFKPLIDRVLQFLSKLKKEKPALVERQVEQAIIQINTGMDFQEQKEYEQAMSCYLKAIELDPQSADAHGTLGLLYQEQDDLSRAIAEFNKALSINPDLVEAYGNRALINKALGNRQLAIADFEKFISMIDDPEYIDIAKEQISELQEQTS